MGAFAIISGEELSRLAGLFVGLRVGGGDGHDDDDYSGELAWPQIVYKSVAARMTIFDVSVI